MRKLAFMKCEQAIKVGQNQSTAYLKHEEYDMTMLDNCTIIVQCKKHGAIARTSLFNVPYWIDMEDLPEADQPRQGASRKKAGQTLEVQ